MKFPNQFRQKFPNQLHNMYEAYNRAMHPFPLDVHEVYRACWTQAEWDAMKLLMPRGVIHKGTALKIKLDSLRGKRPYLNSTLVLEARMMAKGGSFYDRYEFPDCDTNDSEMHGKDMHRELLHWCVTAARNTVIASKVSNYANHAMGTFHGVNTPGQLYRIWPEIACVMPSEYSNRIMHQKNRSALPEVWNDEKLNEFRAQEYFDEINEGFLAMSLMDLERYNREDVYPNVH